MNLTVAETDVLAELSDSGGGNCKPCCLHS